MVDTMTLSSRMQTSVTATATQYLHTGNPIVDTILSMLLACFVSALLTKDWSGKVKTAFTRVFSWLGCLQPTEFQRDVVFTMGGDLNNGSAQSDRAAFDEKDRNFLLQKAILLHLMNTTRQMEEVEMTKAEARLTVARSLPLEMNSHKQCQVFSGSAQQLAAFDVTYLPTSGSWICIDSARSLWFRRVVENIESEKENSTRQIKTTFSLKCKDATGHRVVQDFIEEAMARYRKSKEKELDHTRYYYVAQPSEDGGKMSYKRWPLSDEKTFDSIFFPHKARVLRLLADFEQKQGKFAVPGRPLRLPFLLHGPPGTGKTSFIKALASRTKRHVVEVPLARLASDQQLLDCMLDLHLPVAGLDQPVTLAFQDCIFVMEDIDAAGAGVVAARDTATPNLEPDHNALGLPVAAATGSGPAVQVEPIVLTSQGQGAQVSLLQRQPASKLTLSGLLNALDGAIDTPGRIVVVTTNHPEKLDPALKRPGRMRQILLDYMRPRELCEMARHYLSLPALSPAEEARLGAVALQFEVTPAQVEESCDSAENVEDLVRLLREQLGGTDSAGPDSEVQVYSEPEPELETSGSAESLARAGAGCGSLPVGHAGSRGGHAGCGGEGEEEEDLSGGSILSEEDTILSGPCQ